MRVVSLYTGAGGLDYGFEAAGFETRVALDFERDCCLTLRANREWPVLEGPVETITSRSIQDTAATQAGDVDVLIGGPPCQPFSKSGYWTSGDALRLEDPRARTLFEYMRCVEDLRPRVFLLENVHGISYSGKEEGLVLLHEMAEAINRRQGTRYELSWSILNAADYGVPQARRRFFLIGHRDGKRFKFPKPTHAPEGSESSQTDHFSPTTDTYVTAWDAIGHFTPSPDEDLAMRGRYATLLPSIPEGENYLWHTNRKGGRNLFGWRTRYWSFLLKLAKDRPSWTIQAQPGPSIGPFHWKSRRLSVAEMAAIQTFPPDLEYAGSRVSLQRQLGNAVPSLLAEVLAREIASQFLGRTYETGPKLAVPLNRPIPPPEPLAPVPEEFLHLEGDHADHPGEGQGAAALRRKKTESSLFEAQTGVR